MRNFVEGKRVHFVGVGGISMSALIRIAEKLGAQVSGSDREDSERLRDLLAEGYDVYVGTNSEYAARADIVVCTSAVPEDHPERVAAGDKAVSRGEFLADISEIFDRVVAVAGTHGKTTVSAMIACCLAAGRQSFSAHIGGIARNFGSNIFLSGTDVFVTEACEYKDSFLSLTPDVAVVLNAEIDHGDYFRDEESVFDSFRRFVRGCKDGGIAVLGQGVREKLGLSSNESMRICSYGDDFTCEVSEKGGFYLMVKGRDPLYFTTAMQGAHNIYNAAVAAYVSILLGVSEDYIRMGLAGFLGVKRRYEEMGRTAGGATVVHDYAHHPSEIAAVMKVARDGGAKRVILVFEPHTYSRAKTLFPEFVSVLSEADVLVLLPTYSARETPEQGVTSETLFCALHAPEMYYYSRYEDVKGMLDRTARTGDVVLVLGAGSVERLAASFR